MDEDNVMYKLGAMEALLKSIDQKLDQHIKDTKSNFQDHENRIKKLEANDIRYNTWAGLVGGSAALAVTTLLKVFHIV